MHSSFVRREQGMRVSSFGLGTYLGPMDAATDAGYVEAVQAAVDGGITMIDTSRNYRGEMSEKAIGRALRGRSKDELILCTKAGYFIDRPGHSIDADFLHENLTASLENLQTDRVDVFYIHNPETQRPIVGEEQFYALMRKAFERLENLSALGFLKFYGLATWEGFRTADPINLHRLARMAEEIAGQRHRFRFIQLPFNLAMHEGFSMRNQEDRQSTLQAAAARGISVIGSATILQGRLAQGLPEELAQKLGNLQTDAQRAIQFSRSTPGLLCSLVGMSKAEHVRENLAVAEVAPVKEKDYFAIYGR